MKSFFDKRPLLFAHRGYSQKFPENTLLAFEKAVETGIDVLELDIRLTGDDQLVVFHDEEVSRITEATGLVREYALRDLQQLNAGFHFAEETNHFPYRQSPVKIPGLTELFETFPEQKFNIDIKDNEIFAAEKLWELIQRQHLHHQVLVGSYHFEVLTHFRKLANGTVPTSASSREVWHFGLSQKIGLSRLVPLSLNALQVPTTYSCFNLANRRFIRAVHKRGLFVHYWTVNDPVQIRYLLDLGADGIMSDNPALLMEIYHILNGAGPT